MTKTDRRIRKSQEAIKAAVIELMMEKSFDQITLQDISDRADVSRRTIYLHYMDKFDLLDKLLEEHINELRKLCDAAGAEAEYEDIGLLWFEYLERHYGFFSALLASKGSSFFRNRFLTFFLEELSKADDLSPEESNPELTDGENIELQFLGAAIVGIVEWWFKQDKPVPPVFMAERVGVLLERNLEAESPSM
ncbi:TetR family transcriptional regulator [Saccharibacillus sp. O16]|nr:TetR family transcriptional regulator [Saccharibacillus sp. O16]